jgi:hypothetical protein
MAIYDGDQQSTAPGVINGVHVSMAAAVVKASVANGALAYQFTAAFTMHNPVPLGTPLSYRKGVSYQLDPALRTALLAAGAPMVAL